MLQYIEHYVYYFSAAREHDLGEILEILATQSSTDINRKKKLDGAVAMMFKEWAKQILCLMVLLLVMCSNQDSQLYHQNKALRNIFTKHQVRILVIHQNFSFNSALN